MKKNVMMRVAALLMVCVLATTCGISGTFAKYATEYTGSDNATVAKWKVSVEDVNSDATEKEFTFNIFESIKDTFDSNVDGQVATGMIAPGTWGYFDIDLTNASDVDATYTINFAEALNAGGFTSPIKYKIEVNPAGEATLPDAGLGAVTAGDANDVTFNRGASVIIRVYWVWEFGDPANNANDTKVGVAAQTNPELITVTATVTVEQVD